MTICDFKLRHTLSLHSKAVTCLSLSHCGKWLASGSSDGFVGVWNVSSGLLLQKLDFRIAGPVLNLCWAPELVEQGRCCLIAATSDSKVRLWSSEAEPEASELVARWAVKMLDEPQGQIEAIALCGLEHNATLAVAGGTKLSLFQLRGIVEVKLIRTENFQATVRSVQFIDGGSTIAAGLLESRELFIWRLDPWSMLMQVELSSRIAHLAWSPEYRTLAVANLVDGVDLYQQLEPPVWSKSLTRANVKNNIKQVTFSHHGCFVVSGGDLGSVPVWNRADGETVQMLEHGGESSIQVIATSSSPTDYVIATGESEGAFRVFIWAQSRVFPIDTRDTDVAARVTNDKLKNKAPTASNGKVVELDPMPRQVEHHDTNVYEPNMRLSLDVWMTNAVVNLFLVFVLAMIFHVVDSSTGYLTWIADKLASLWKH